MCISRRRKGWRNREVHDKEMVVKEKSEEERGE
jgi:hypothetical protein